MNPLVIRLFVPVTAVRGSDGTNELRKKGGVSYEALPRRLYHFCKKKKIKNKNEPDQKNEASTFQQLLLPATPKLSHMEKKEDVARLGVFGVDCCEEGLLKVIVSL